MQKEQIKDLAIQYATEGLDAEHKVIYDAWVLSASEQDKMVFAEMVDVCALISPARSTDKIEISDTVKTDLLGVICHQHPTGDDVLTIREEDQEWINLPVKGAKWLELSARKKDGFVMSMIEVEPGTKFPEHDHHGVEMAYILEGDLEADGVTLYKGDFFRADAGTHHGTHFSPSGCRALIVTASENYQRKTMKIIGGLQKIYRKFQKSSH